MIGTREMKEKNRAFFLELAHFLQKSTFVLFVDRASEGLLMEFPIISQKKEIGILQSTQKDATLFRQSTGNVLLIASSIPDKIEGELFQKSVVEIGNSLKVSFEILNSNLLEDKRIIIMKIIS